MKRRKEIAVELTSLLDVILIMLFLVMSQSQSRADAIQSEAEAAIAEYESELDSAQENIEKQKNELEQIHGLVESYEAFEKYAVIVSVSVGEYKNDEHVIYISDSEETQTVVFSWDNMRYGENAFEAVVSGYVCNSDENPVFITFSYDSTKIYLRDYNMISSVMDKIQGNNDNVYIKYEERSDLYE